MGEMTPDVTPNDHGTFSFLCGTAGTGKTYQQRLRALNDPSCLLVATTGIAAINLGGTTIHACLGYFDTDSLREKFLNQWLDEDFKKWWVQGKRNWILDEASMLSKDALTYLTRSIIRTNMYLKLAYAAEGDEFRPITLTLVGDFAQLPPVKEPFAFESPEWERYEADTTVLHEFKRHSDPDFIAALQEARRGNARKALDYFEQFMVLNTDAEYDGTTIMALNKAVDNLNQLRLDELEGESKPYKSKREGRLLSEWKKIPETVELKQGALVMVLANERYDEGESGPNGERFEYVNGDLGVIEEMYDGSVRVLLERNNEPVHVSYVQREHKKPLEGAANPRAHTEDRRLGFEVLGRISYMPIRLAYATTCHKSQGLSLDRAQVNINNRFFSTPGMLYVALSRVRTPKGLTLVGRPEAFLQRCKCDERVRRWL